MKKRMQSIHYKALKRSTTKDNIMCEKLKELKGVSAEKILDWAGEENNVPVNMDKIIKKIGIFKEAIDFSDIEESEKNGKISGLVLIIGDDVKILYNIKDTLEDKRFIAAHEIAHCCLHGEEMMNDYIEFYGTKTLGDELENEASDFASRLLIPRNSLNYVYNRLIKPTIKALSQMFQVPEKLMKKRLDEEGLKTSF